MFWLFDNICDKNKTGHASIASHPVVKMLEALKDFQKNIISKPEAIYEMNIKIMDTMQKLYEYALSRYWNDQQSPIIEPEKSDRRFKHKGWTEHLLFDLIKQNYLSFSKIILDTVDKFNDDDSNIKFYIKHYLDVLSPTNNPFSNPEVIESIIKTNGKNIIDGWKNFTNDLQKKQFFIEMKNNKVFQFGADIAATKGEVIFENDIMQLIQYYPLTKKVFKEPLLVIPPWIKKYYIFDLRQENSFVKWALEHGHSVFVISWVNPSEEHSHNKLEDYMEKGIIVACNIMQKIMHTKLVHAMGYCLGGTLLALTEGYLKGTNQQFFRSITLLTTLVDFSEIGDFKIFVENEYVDKIAQYMEATGFLDGYIMNNAFNALKANDMIWSYYINNYLLGNEPFDLDFLYWNAEPLNMAKNIHLEVLRLLYQENALTIPNKIVLKNIPIDLSNIKTNSFLVAAYDDHITPWKGVFKTMKIFGNNVEFVLTKSGHVAGVINHPSQNKYGYWTNQQDINNPDDWINSAEYHKGSWWNEWIGWIAENNHEKIDAVAPIKGIEQAPGKYCA